MVEQLLPQVVADALAQDAGQEDKAEHADGLNKDQRAINADDAEERFLVAGQDALVHDPLAEEGKEGIQGRYCRDGDQKADEPRPVGLGLGQDAQQGPAVEFGTKFFFFELEFF